MKKYRIKTDYDWTVMIYMASNDPEAARAANKFLSELMVIGKLLNKHRKKDRVKFVLMSLGNWNGRGKKKAYYTRYYAIQNNFLRKRRLTLDCINANMGDPTNLREFIGRSQEIFTAKKYMLLLWGHGTGTGMLTTELKEAKTNITYLKQFLRAHALQKEPPGFTEDYFDETVIEKEIIQSREKKPTYLFWLAVPLHKKLRYYIPSKARLDCLRAKEISDCLKICFRRSNPKIDVVAILGCTMQMVEFGYEIRKKCKYLVACEELMWWEGYNYKKTFSALLKKPTMDGRELSIRLIKDTTSKPSYTEKEKREIAISCVDLQCSNRIARQISDISNDILNSYRYLKDDVAEARYRCYHLGEDIYDSFIDITRFLKKLGGFLKPRAEFKTLYKKITSLVKLIEEKYVIAKYIGPDRSNMRDYQSIGAHGVCIYFPYGKIDHSDNYELGVPFNKNSPYRVQFASNKWNHLVRKFAATLKDNPKASNDKL